MLDINSQARLFLSAIIHGAEKSLNLTPDPKIASFLSNSKPEQSPQACEAFKLLNLDLLFQMGCELHISPTEKKARLARSIWLQKEADELQQVLVQENIRFAFLKGTAFDARYWSHTGLRYFMDIDLLIHPEDFDLSLKKITELNYSLNGQSPIDGGPKTRSTVDLVRKKDPWKTSVDLHRFPFDAFRHQHQWNNLWARIQHQETPIGTRAMLPPEDEVVYWAGNQLKSLFSEWPKACLDIYVLLKKEEMNWDDIIRNAREAKLVWPLWTLLALIQTVSCSTTIPTNVLNQLRPPTWAQHKMTQLIENTTRNQAKSPVLSQRVLWNLILSQDKVSAIKYLFVWAPQRLGDKLMKSRVP